MFSGPFNESLWCYSRFSHSPRNSNVDDDDEGNTSSDPDDVKFGLSSSFQSRSGSWRRYRNSGRSSTPDRDRKWSSMRLPSPRVRRRDGDLPSPLRGFEDSLDLPEVEIDDEDARGTECKLRWSQLLALNKPEFSFIAVGCVASLLTGM